ncbi:MAG: 6,7-dimethyl-8-ribityllumazine synthase [Thalassobaculaceae bacterium]|nr:6,7-dimethyl-8-ribityllumazine synthase [Thalassobaculaceae bacterium]
MPRVLIVEARFYEDIADELVRGAIQHLEAAGVEYDRITVPGAFEVPAAISFAYQGSLKGGVAYDGYIALGCVIRGETTHYDYVCGESARGLQDLAIRDNLAIGYGILTVENDKQAWARAGVESGKNKGKDAAEACLAMVSLRHQFALS